MNSIWSRRVAWLMAVVAIYLAPPAPATELPSAGEVFARHLQAIGGREALRQTRTMVFRGEVDLTPLKVKAPIEIIVQGTNQFLTRLKYHHAFGGFLRIPFVGVRAPECGFDGKYGWLVDLDKNVEPLEGLDRLYFHALLDKFSPLYFGREIRLARTLDVQRFADRDCYRVLVVFPFGARALEYYDVSTGLLAGAEYPFETDNGVINTRLTYSELRRTANQCLAPFRIDVFVGGDQYILRAREIRTDAPLATLSPKVKFNPTASPILKPTALDAPAVIGRYLEALGGREVIRAHQSLRITGQYCTPGPHGFTNDIEILAAAPNRFFLSLPIPGGLHRQGYDGEHYWRANGSRITFATGRDLEQRLEAIRFPHELHDPANFRFMETLGTIQFDGEECVQLLLIRKSGEIFDEFYSLGTGLLRGLRSFDEANGGAVLRTEYLSDYRRFGDRMLDAHWVSEGMGFVQMLNISHAEWDQVPAAAFELPPEVKAVLTEPRPAAGASGGAGK